jgi:S-DNA-T family DNA segregation ATPase FtsK/SpoIIIE
MPEETKQTPGSVPEHQTRQRLIGFLLLPLSLFPLLALITYDWRDIAWLQVPPNDPPANFIGIVGAWATFAGYSLVGLALWLVPVWLVTVGVLLVAGRTVRLGRRTAWAVLFLVSTCALLQLADGLTGGLLTRLNGAPNGGGAMGQLVMSGVLARWLSPVGGGILAACTLVGSGVMVVGPRHLADGFRRLVGAVQAWRTRSADQEAAREQARTEQDGQEERERLQREKDAARLAREQARTEKERLRDEERQRKEEAAAERQQAVDERRRQLSEEQQRAEDRKNDLRRKVEESRAAAQREKQPPPAPAAPAAAVAEVSQPAESGPAAAAPEKPAYILPTIDLLDQIPEGDAVHGDVERTAQTLVESLKTFNLDCEVTHIERGPVITQYELLPAPGIRVERIVALSNTLQLVLKATSLRVQAPVPGKGVVGIEVPNQVARKVTLREVLEGEAWTTNRMEIPLALGKDVSGRDLLIDLAQAPHLLVAGATGSGKSVCLNAILAGLLMRRTPDELKLILVDPKRVEFPPYNDLPHLLVPVITDPKKVAFSLRWTLAEMDRRYKLLQATKQRNIVGFNNRAAMTQADLFERNGEAESGVPAKLPYIVIVIDEVADLMMTVGQEIEGSITRLAQLSRAVGIHMVLATQRPSVNVITGTIKANFPGRIAFQVAQKVDSRTILDSSGAETLIGRGDMLFLNPKTSRLMRAQGALVNDGEINRLVEFIKKQGKPNFDLSLAARLEKVQELVADAGDDEEDGAAPVAPVDGKDDADEELIQQSLQVIRDTRRASTSSLQRRLRIGYTRAARIIDILEERGILGPPRGSDPREILIDLDAGIPNNPTDGIADDLPTDASTASEDEPGGAKA